MPIAVYTRIEGDVGRCPTPQQGKTSPAPADASATRLSGATCGDCAFFEAETSTCVGQSVDAKDSAARCFLFVPRRAEP